MIKALLIFLVAAVTPIDFGAIVTSQPVYLNGKLIFSATNSTYGDELFIVQVQA